MYIDILNEMLLAFQKQYNTTAKHSHFKHVKFPTIENVVVKFEVSKLSSNIMSTCTILVIINESLIYSKDRTINGLDKLDDSIEITKELLAKDVVYMMATDAITKLINVDEYIAIYDKIHKLKIELKSLSEHVNLISE